MNVKVGITQYVSDGEGFSAYWQYSDVQVVDKQNKSETLIREIIFKIFYVGQ